MPIIESVGDLLESGAQVLVDLNNCVGVSGAGLAKAFKRAIPDHYNCYKMVCETEGPRPGDAIIVLYRDWGTDGFQVPRTISLFTKNHWRDSTKVEWVESCLVNLRGILVETNKDAAARSPREKPLSVAMAHPGCGNGGLTKEVVRPLVNGHLGDLPNTVYLFGV